MISQEEQKDLNDLRINFLINKLDSIEGLINSYINNAEILSDKYSLEDVLPDLNSQKEILLEELEQLGGTWSSVN